MYVRAKPIHYSIADYIDSIGYKRKEIAKRIGVTEPVFSMMLNGSRKIQLEEYARICGALDVNTDYFLKPIKTKN